MPKTTSSTVVHSRLSEVDYQRLKEQVKAQKVSESHLVREAIRRYLDYADKQALDHGETKVERRLKRMEDRLASLLARLGVDIGIVYQFLWHQSDPETRNQLFNKCYKDSRNRLAGKLDKIETEFKELIKEAVLAEDKPAAKPE